MVSKTKAQESEATRQAGVELQAMARALRGFRRRLVATAKRLRAADSTAAVVDSNTDGRPYTVEGWSADTIDPAPLDGGCTTVLEAIDEALERIARAADADRIRAEIRRHCEYDRATDARRASAN